MRFLLDIGHPAHVHYFKHLITSLRNNGHTVFITTKDIGSVKTLLTRYGLEYIVLPRKSDSIAGKAINQMKYDWLLLKICRDLKIDYTIGVSITIAHLSGISKIKSFVFDDDDDEVQPLFVKWGQPYATELLSPDVLKGKQKRKDVIYYPGYHELAYLHPNRFSPDEGVLSEVGLKKGDPYFILRFNAFRAHHDKGIRGLSPEDQKKLVQFLSERGRVLITSERDLVPDLKQYQITISPARIHSLMYYATMFVGDSQTMTSEAAVLGTPSVRFNSFAGKISYLEEEEHKYGLTFGFKPGHFEPFLNKIKELLEYKDLKTEWQNRRKIMLNNKIDVTSFWLWFIENYPVSKKDYLSDPDIASRFV
jgi:hypothetical protein